MIICFIYYDHLLYILSFVYIWSSALYMIICFIYYHLFYIWSSALYMIICFIYGHLFYIWSSALYMIICFMYAHMLYIWSSDLYMFICFIVAWDEFQFVYFIFDIPCGLARLHSIDYLICFVYAYLLYCWFEMLFFCFMVSPVALLG